MTETSTPLDAAAWRQRLTDLIHEHQVPGAALGILHGGGIVDVAAGVLNKRTGVEATPDSVFQIGSISKVWTATLVLQLVDEGAITLDTPVSQVIPGLTLHDSEVAKTVTVRHLLTHTSGIDGDVFTDTGRGDDCLEKYVDQLAEVEQNHPLGVTWSYCNTGYSLLGRLVEVLTDKTWDAALRERVVEPLGLSATMTLPEEALLHRAAAGHVAESGQEPHVAPSWVLQRSAGPAGLIIARVHDLLAFARMHLAGGVTPDGTRILSAESARAMTDHQVDVPDPTELGDSWGLGWIREGWGETRLVGHDGSTLGQYAFLKLVPEHGVAVAVLTNGGHAAALAQQLFAEVFDQVAGLSAPEPFAPPENPPTLDLAPYCGSYARAGLETVVLERDGGLVLQLKLVGELAALSPEPEQELELVPVTAGQFAFRMDDDPVWHSAMFYEPVAGSPYVHYGGRANPRVAT